MCVYTQIRIGSSKKRTTKCVLCITSFVDGEESQSSGKHIPSSICVCINEIHSTEQKKASLNGISISLSLQYEKRSCSPL